MIIISTSKIVYILLFFCYAMLADAICWHFKSKSPLSLRLELRKPYSILEPSGGGNHFWSRGYCVDTIGLDEDKIKKYVKYQEEQERIEEQQKAPIWPLLEALSSPPS